LVTNRMDASEEWDIAVCGLNCPRCGIHQAYNNKDREWQVRIGKDIFGEDADIDPETIRCGGCRGSLEIHWSENCNLRKCAEERGHTYCFECDDFVCEKLEDFGSHGPGFHARTVENMKQMKEIGLNAWLLKQQEKGPAVMCP
jgi:hypothetical protein